MRYKVSRKVFGTKIFEILAEIETDQPIIDFCWVEDLGLIYSSGTILGLITLSGSQIHPWKGAIGEEPRNGSSPYFGMLSGLSYNPKIRCLFAGEDGGRDVRCIDIKDDYTSSMIKMETKNIIGNLLKNTPKNSIVWVSGVRKYEVFLAIPSLRKCFLFNNSYLSHIAGDGQRRFANGKNASTTSIGLPSGILFYEGRIYLADDLRHIVREVHGESIRMVAGHPKKQILLHPSNLVAQNNSLYILCKDGIWSYLLNHNTLGKSQIYESNNVISITADLEKTLFIMETDNA
jgi:hypothetical protein